MKSCIRSLEGIEDDNGRWQKAVSTYEYAVLTPNLQNSMSTVRWWEYPEKFDAVSETMIDMYYSKYIVNDVRKHLDVSIDEWLSKPIYQCERDLTLIENALKIKMAELEDLEE